MRQHFVHSDQREPVHAYRPATYVYARKDIELGNLANIQSDDNFSDTDSDNDLEEILDMEIDDTDCMTIENNTNSFMV